MLALIATATVGGLGILAPIIDLGATGVLFILVWRLMVKKDRKSYQMIEAMNKERRELYEAQTELVREVTTALVDKNNTDDKMAAALIKLAEELRTMREAGGRQNDQEA